MHDRRGRRGVAPPFRRHRASAAADKEDQVRGVDDRPGLGRAAVAADDADRQRVAVGDRALAADRRRDAGAQPLRHRLERHLRPRDQPRRRRRRSAAAAATASRSAASATRGRVGNGAPRRIAAPATGPPRSPRPVPRLSARRTAGRYGRRPAVRWSSRLKARRKAFGTSAARSTTSFHLVSGRNRGALVEFGQRITAPRRYGDVRGDAEHRHG